MRGANHCVETATFRSNQLQRLGFGRIAPEQEDDSLFSGSGISIHRTDDFVRDLFPPSFLVRICLTPAHRQHRVEQEDALLGPTQQVTVIGASLRKVRDILVLHKFLVHVL